VLIACAFLLYSVVREMAAGRDAAAFTNAFDVIRLEQSLGIFHEEDLQRLTLSSVAVTKFFNAVYTYGHMPLVIGVAVWLFVFDRGRYTVFRNAVLLSGAVALLCYNVFPMAPPRLVPEPHGMEDTLSMFQSVNYHSAGAFVNHYAAMPSMHIGWNLLACVALASAVNRRLFGMAVLALPLLMAVAVIVTGNHFILDIVGGYVVAAIGLGGALLVKDAGARLIPRAA
jgi:membrane-associated phospholipid phosphatase